MKRMWIGIVLLLVLLGGGLGAAYAMEKAQTPVIGALSRASREALAGNWQQAGKHAAMAQAQWENNWEAVASLADHTPMEEIDGLFAELRVFLHTREDVHFSAACARLCKQLRAMSEAHTVNWHNLL